MFQNSSVSEFFQDSCHASGFLTLFELVFQFQSAKMSAFAVYNTPYAPQDLGLLENDQ